SEKRLRPFPSTPEGAPTSALGQRSGAPSGLRPSSFVMCNTPVEVQFTSAGCLNYPCRTPYCALRAAPTYFDNGCSRVRVPGTTQFYGLKRGCLGGHSRAGPCRQGENG